MSGFTDRLSQLRRVVGDKDLATLAVQRARLRMRSEDEAYGLRRDLTTPHTAPTALIEIGVRPIRPDDVEKILGTDDDALDAEEKWERSGRRRLLESGAGTCYVAVTAEDEPCYMQWLFGERDNAFVQRYFAGSFPVLDPDTALLEGAYTPAAFRGQRIMSAAMAHIAAQADGLGARYVITFVGVDNIASLKGCYRTGFAVHLRRTQRWRAFRRSVTFRPVDDPGLEAIAG